MIVKQFTTPKPDNDTQYRRIQKTRKLRYGATFSTTRSDRHGVNCPLHHHHVLWIKSPRFAAVATSARVPKRLIVSGSAATSCFTTNNILVR